MTKWSDLRTNIDAAVKSFYRVDDWYLDTPEPEIQTYPPNRGALFPATDIGIVRSRIGCETSVSVTYEVKYWFTDDLEYHQLPIFSLEALLIGGLGYLVGGGIQGMDGIRIEGSSPGLMVERLENNMPWVCILPLNLRLVGAFEIEEVPSLQSSPSSNSTFEIEVIDLNVDNKLLQS